MVEEPVEDRGGEDVVAEDCAPFVERLVGVMIVEPRSYRREISWKNMFASSRSSLR